MAVGEAVRAASDRSYQGGVVVMVFDQRQQEMLDDIEIEILNYVASLPLAETVDDLKRELEHFGYTLGNA